MKPYNLSIKEILKEYHVDPKQGLSEIRIKDNKQIYGENEIKRSKKISPIKIFISQFRSFMIYILLFAVIISILSKEFIDASVIMAILIFNAFFGFIQEYKAEKSIEALKKLAALQSIVIRNGKIEKIFAKDLVPGDIILIEEGDKIPADARLIESTNLELLEASLTGESLPVEKFSQEIKESKTIAERKNMVFSGTIVTKGRAKAIVTSIGMETEMGKIAHILTETPEEIMPLQKKLESFGKWIGLGTLLISAVIFIIGIYKDSLLTLLFADPISFILNSETKKWLITSVSLAVAAIPEGLPAIVTITLALGVRKMLKKNALIRRLPAVETLGETNVICTDKTGTLTKNEMTVKKAFISQKEINFTGEGYECKGHALANGKPLNKDDLLIFKIGVLCNNASLEKENASILGDPTEAALLVSAEKAGINHLDLIKNWERIKEEPFNSINKTMFTINKDPKTKKEFIFAKGAPEKIIEKCTKIYQNGRIVSFTDKLKKEIISKNEEYTKQALRVLAFAYKPHKRGSINKDLIFVGLQGMIDPPRPEVKESIEKCKEAGIRVIIITGDHKNTAEAIAKEIGVEGEAIDGFEFESFSDEEKIKAIENFSIFARVEPSHKMEIVSMLKEKGRIVAMTGDGVNDAPALKRADIGIAMGIKGTEVSREASDIILEDDNFSTIVNAIEEGRGIYENIRKFVNYLISSNIAEVMIIFLAILIGWPLPITAIMILWINLVTDGLPALALGVDPNPKNLMSRPPKKSQGKIMNKSMIINISIISSLMTIAILTLLFISMRNYSHLPNAEFLPKIQTIIFTAIILMELARLQAVRSEYKIGIFSNKYLILAIASSILLQLIIIYTPLNNIFKVSTLNVMDWSLIIGFSAGVFILNLVILKIKNLILK